MYIFKNQRKINIFNAEKEAIKIELKKFFKVGKIITTIPATIKELEKRGLININKNNSNTIAVFEK